MSAYQFVFLAAPLEDHSNQNQEVTAEVEVTDEWEDGYYARLVVKNNTDKDIVWNVNVNVEGTVTNLWNGLWSQIGSILSIQGYSWNGHLDPGEINSTVGFCVTKS